MSEPLIERQIREAERQSEPTVACIMITRDRPEYARRAVEAFRAQTYENKRLLILDNGITALTGEHIPAFDAAAINQNGPIVHVLRARAGFTVGALRNEACFAARYKFQAHIFVHLDDDDYSHPNRISEQVTLLQSSGADCVGYRDMLFWNEDGNIYIGGCYNATAKAYLYSNPDPTYCLGTSLCYWRRTWERNQFSERNGPNPRERGEDREFLRGIKSLGVSTVHFGGVARDPRMIARIHAGNAAHYPVDELVQTSQSWLRAPEWDQHCRTIMEGK